MNMLTALAPAPLVAGQSFEPYAALAADEIHERICAAKAALATA